MPSKPGRPRKWSRKSKAQRKSLKMWAEGARETILCPHIEPYTDALERGWRAERDYLQKVCNEYHAKISWRLGDTEEPSLPLPDYDQFAPPTLETLSDEERDARHARQNQLNERICRWLKYQARSLRRGIRSSASLRDNPFAVFLAKLAGITTPPKARQGFQQYMHESYATDIEPEVTARWKAQSINPDGSANAAHPDASFRSKIARELFKALPQEEQDALRGRATAEAQEAKLKYAKAMTDGPSKSPEARQKCIDGFGRFMAPIMKGVQQYTGLQGFVVFGGPMPRFNGEIRTIHISVGTNLAHVPTPLPNWDKLRWQSMVGFFKDYLKTAYSTDECTEATLPDPASLTQAPYRFDDDDSESDSSSSESSDSDSSDSEESDSDDETTSKKAKKGKAQAKAKKSGAKRKRGTEKEAQTGAASSKRAKKDARRRGSRGRDARRVERGRDARRVERDAAAARLRDARRATNSGSLRPTPENGSGNPASEGDGKASAPTMPPASPTPPPASPVSSEGASQNNDGGARPASNEDTVMGDARAVCPVDAPPWVKDAYQEISREPIGPRFEEMVDAWLRLEKSYGFVQGNGTLRTKDPKDRPGEVKEWVRDGRGRTMAVIPIPNRAAFEQKWWKWWTALQPSWRGSWRGRSSSAPCAPQGGGWESLAVPGRNGLLSVVATLYWWGCAEKKDGIEARSAEWEEAAAEVISVLRALRVAE
ncbi:hypothetical protein DFH06DRAFT_1013683 [Mycena polygramma]|nr:hypothetical protein DFH06DRAFT_1013683 [Mycena polygramma]